MTNTILTGWSLNEGRSQNFKLRRARTEEIKYLLLRKNIRGDRIYKIWAGSVPALNNRELCSEVEGRALHLASIQLRRSTTRLEYSCSTTLLAPVSPQNQSRSGWLTRRSSVHTRILKWKFRTKLWTKHSILF
jgi:hypothetical protein